MNTDTDIDEYKVQEHSRHEFVTKHLYLLVKDSCIKLQIPYNQDLIERLYNSFLETYSLSDLVTSIKIIKTFAIKLISYFVVYSRLLGKLMDPIGKVSCVDIQTNIEKIMSSMRVIHLKAVETYYEYSLNKEELLPKASKMVSLVTTRALFIVFQLYLLSRPEPVVNLQDIYQGGVKVLSYI